MSGLFLLAKIDEHDSASALDTHNEYTCTPKAHTGGFDAIRSKNTMGQGASLLAVVRQSLTMR